MTDNDDVYDVITQEASGPNTICFEKDSRKRKLI